MNIVLLGLPGSGKGTQADILAQKLGLFHFSAGELARELAKTDPRIEEIIASGALIPEEEMTEYVSEYLNKYAPTGNKIFFEGYPRFVSQYQYLKDWLAKKSKKIDRVIFLEISEDEVIKRLSTRRTCVKCERIYNLVTDPPPSPEICHCGGKLFQRDDDNPESIKKRFEAYRSSSQPLIDLLKSEGNLLVVDGSKSIPEVTADILAGIKNG